MSKKQHRGKFRHVFGEPAKKEKQFLDIKSPLCQGQGNYVASNARFFAVAKSSGGGPVYIIRHDAPGRISSGYPMLSVHKGKIWDMDFNPFIPNVIATASNDCSVGITQFPINGLTETITQASGQLKGHSKKCILTSWNPVATGILASGSFDRTVRVWDVEKLQSVCKFSGHSDTLYSMEWNINGSMIATTSKDKQVRVFDPRTDGENVSATESFSGSKSSHVFWCDQFNWVGSTGFSKIAKRKLKIWDIRNMGKPIHDYGIDQASSILMPFFDRDTGVLFLAGKGEGKVSYSELVNDDKKVYSLGVYRNPTPQKGGGWVPKRALNVWKCEIARFLKLTSSYIQPVSFIVPRKAGRDVFQEDIFPDAYAGKPNLEAVEWANGNNKDIITTSLDPSVNNNNDVTDIPTMSIKPQTQPVTTTKNVSKPQTQPVTATQPVSRPQTQPVYKPQPQSVTTTSTSTNTNNTDNNNLKQDNDKLRNENEELKNQNETLQKQIKELNSKINQLNDDTNRLSNDLKNEKEETSALQNTIKTRDNEIIQLKESLSNNEQQINTLTEQINSLKQENNNLKEENTNLSNNNNNNNNNDNNENNVTNTDSDNDNNQEEQKPKVPNPFEDEDDDESSLF